MDEKKKSSMVDQMMAAMARKNAQHYPETKNADGTVKATKPRRGTGPVPKPMKKSHWSRSLTKNLFSDIISCYQKGGHNA